MAFNTEEIAAAVSRRIAESRQQVETITMRQLRRLLEKDMGLPEFALDTEKTLIKAAVEKALLEDMGQPHEAAGEGDEEEDASVRGGLDERVAREEEPKSKLSAQGSAHGASRAKVQKGPQTEDEDGDEKPESRKRTALSVGRDTDNGPEKKRRVKQGAEDDDLETEEDKNADGTRNAQRLAANGGHEDDGIAGEAEEEEEDEEDYLAHKARAEEEGESDEQGSAGSEEESERKRRKPAVKQKSRTKAVPTTSARPADSRRVEQLKEVIQACGMKIAPQVYRRAKQAPEEKRDGVLVRELEAILEKEGLSSRPSEKEIKATKRRLQKRKELEGIDLSNIVDQPRGRRAVANDIFAAPLSRPKKDGSDADGEEEDEDGDEEDDEDEADDDDDEDEEEEDFDAEDAEEDDD